MALALDSVSNFTLVTVSTGYSSGATSIVLNSGQGALLPAAPFNLVWWNSTDYTNPALDPNVEIVRVTNISTDTLTVTRAQESSTATSKNTGGKTYQMLLGITAKMITDIGKRLLNPQTPTGTVNGSNTSFNATGIVNVAVVDGVIDFGSTITGTVNSAITTSVPPQNSIYAF